MAWLGVNYINRYLSRMAVAMAALMIAIAMLISVSLMIRSFRQAVDNWIGQSVSGDLFVAHETQLDQRTPQPTAAGLLVVESLL